jgi:beta-glucuronidase
MNGYRAAVSLSLCLAGLCVLPASQAAHAGQPGGPSFQIANAQGRKITSLNGKWRTIVDPYENGYYDFRMEMSREGYFLNLKPKDKNDRVEYDFDTSETLDVPGDWNSQRDSLYFYEGTVWYKKSFDYRPRPGMRLFLHFGGANYETMVFLNGERIGGHIGGFTPFDFEITDKVRETGNFVIVKVDNKRHREGVPTLNTDWWNYGGLTREVALVEVPATFVQDYFVQLMKGSTGTVAGWVRLDGAQPRQRVTVSIPEARASVTVSTDAEGYAEFSFPAAVTLWSPENPKLYEVRVESESDSVEEQIGFRTIETKGTQILLNGQPVFLRGVSIHEEAPFRAGRAFSVEDSRTLLGWAKEMGCNFVRLAHYPHNEFMVREADRLGLLVWSEAPVYWMIDWKSAATLRNASNQITESITRDRNRAAIILWSVANETPINEERNAFLNELTALVRRLDPTRLTTAAMMHHEVAGTSDVVLDDPLGNVLDVLGCNEYLGWYDGPPEKADGVTWKSPYNKPMVMSEFGAGALFGLHGDATTRWTEEFQERVFRHQVPMLKRIPFLSGTSPWVLMDFRSPRRVLPGVQDFFNRKGLISERGDKKKAFFVMQEFYRAKAQE